MSQQHRFNFETQYEEQQYDKLVRLCTAPLGFIESEIQHYDLTRWNVLKLAKEIEKQHKLASK